jgi:hypothetical protein
LEASDADFANETILLLDDQDAMMKICDRTSGLFQQWIERLISLSESISFSFHGSYAERLALTLGANGFTTITSLISEAFSEKKLLCIRFYLLSYRSLPALTAQWYAHLFHSGIISTFFASGAWHQVADGSFGAVRWLAWLLSNPISKQMVVSQVLNFWLMENRDELIAFYHYLYLITNQRLSSIDRDTLLGPVEREYYTSANLENVSHQKFLASCLPSSLLVNKMDFIHTLPLETRNQLYDLSCRNESPISWPCASAESILSEYARCNPNQLMVHFDYTLKEVLSGNNFKNAPESTPDEPILTDLTYLLQQPISSTPHYTLFEQIFSPKRPSEIRDLALSSISSEDDFRTMANGIILQDSGDLSFPLSSRASCRYSTLLESFMEIPFDKNLSKDQLTGSSLWITSYYQTYFQQLAQAIQDIPSSIYPIYATPGEGRSFEETLLGPVLKSVDPSLLTETLSPYIQSDSDVWYKIVIQIPSVANIIAEDSRFTQLRNQILIDQTSWL